MIVIFHDEYRSLVDVQVDVMLDSVSFPYICIESFKCHTGFCRSERGRSSLTNEKDYHYFLNTFMCVCGFFDS